MLTALQEDVEAELRRLKLELKQKGGIMTDETSNEVYRTKQYVNLIYS